MRQPPYPFTLRSNPPHRARFAGLGTALRIAFLLGTTVGSRAQGLEHAVSVSAAAVGATFSGATFSEPAGIAPTAADGIGALVEALPDAPDILAQSTSGQPAARHFADPSSNSGSATRPATATFGEASPHQKYVEAGQAAPPLTPTDKMFLGVKYAFSPFAVAGWVAAAGYEQGRNSSPNYGTDRGAFGQRLGVAAVRGVSEDVLSDSVMSNLFHQDPRYYRMGPSRSPLLRLFYAASRPLITRTDSGRTSLNLSHLSGNLTGSALTNLYYPQTNRSASQTLSTFGGSLAGSAFGDVINEFFGNYLHRSR